MRNHLFFIVVFLIDFSSTAQVNYPRDYFAPPVTGPLTLAGNFGEIRPNHLHAGFDIRTNNKEGMPVYAAADGYVSRIRISAVGYGKALYISHPNGYVSVYGHLRSFNPAIHAKAISLQTQLETFEIDTLLNRELLPVKKGELIGFSGNTGSSQAPHLHFEIRNEQTEMPINPYFFGYQVKDEVKPTILSIAVYPLNETASINNKNRVKKIIPQKIKDSYLISKADSITVNGEIGFGINCYDRESGGSGKNNVFSIELLSGGKRLYYYEMETFSFDNARYVNAHIDYAEKQKNRQTIQKCFLAKNNLLEIYKGVTNRGIIDFKDDQEHWITFIVRDYAGNKAELALKVKSTSVSKLPLTDHVKHVSKYLCEVNNEIAEAEFQAVLPPLSLYDDEVLEYNVIKPVRGLYSHIYQVGDETVALQKAIVIKMYVQGIQANLLEKLCIVSIEKNGKYNYEGGTSISDFVFSEIKHLGKFAVTMDTDPPEIRPLLQLPKNNSIADLSNMNVLKFKATDNLSGIKKYRATIDGNWVLCEYDAKNDLLFHTFDGILQPGVHHFKLEVTDDRGNMKEWKCIFKK